jgi:acetoin utilization deacetylase AcuC-like enzyme
VYCRYPPPSRPVTQYHRANQMNDHQVKQKGSVAGGRRALIKGTALSTAATMLVLARPSPAAHSNEHSGSNRTAWVYDSAYLTPVFPPEHPEQPARVAAIANAIQASSFSQRLTRLEPKTYPAPVLNRALKLIHTKAHIEALDARYDAAIMRLARLAVRGTLSAIDAVQSKQFQNVFVCSRPPGHHARNTGQEEGFCFFNHVSIAARYAQSVHRVRRVLIIDWDYHHGDGTEHFFYEDASVMVFNTYDPLAYPRVGDPARKGSGAGLGNNINIPLRCGAGDAEIERAFRLELVPAANRFKPDLVLISCGFDSRINDPLGCFGITDDGYRAITRIAMDIANRHGGGRIVSVLEGGYNLSGLASASLAHISTLLEYRNR